MSAKDRYFTQLAAEVLGPENAEALKVGQCPICLGEIGPFRNNRSIKEFNISGMCQKCQDNVFGID